MENVTGSSAVAMAASLANETVTPAVQGTAGGTLVFIAWICVISVVLFGLISCIGLPALGFIPTGIAAASFAAGWMSSIGLVAAGSLFALLQSIAMGGVPALTVLLCIFAVVALAAGAFQAIVWLIHAASHLHLFSWLVESWNSIAEWVHHLECWNSIAEWVHHLESWNSIAEWVHYLSESWNSIAEWVHHLWSSIPVHHKWKILYT